MWIPFGRLKCKNKMALYLPKSKALMILIPKTGCIWRYKALEKLDIEYVRWDDICKRTWSPHYTASHYMCTCNEKFQSEHKDCFKGEQIDFIATFVRHPVAWYESIWKYYQYRTRKEPRRMKWDVRKVGKNNIKDQITFDDWVDTMLTNHPLWYTRAIDLYCGPPEAEWCHWIGRTETLEEDWLEILEILGYQINDEQKELIHSMGPENQSTTEIITWNPELKQKVIEMEHEVIERFYGENIGQRKFGIYK